MHLGGLVVIAPALTSYHITGQAEQRAIRYRILTTLFV